MDIGTILSPRDYGLGFNGRYVVGDESLEGTGLEVTVNTNRFARFRILERWLTIRNNGTDPVTLDRVDTIRLPLPPGDWRLRWYRGEGTAEFQPREEPLTGPVVIETRSGRSCNGAHPWFGLVNERGEVLCGSVAWSGNHAMRFERDGDGWVVSGGLNDWGFSTTLAPGETFRAPSVVLALAEDGDWDAAARAFHRWVRGYGCRRVPLANSMPVEWNHWWPYDDSAIDEEVFRANAEAAARMGIDVVTLDAGWFGKTGPTNWYDVRGDWEAVNRDRFPHGIRPLSDHAHSLGLKFGLWCEIEAVGKNAFLNERYANIIAGRAGKSLGYICFGNAEARAWAADTLDRLITDYSLDWVKIDFNVDPGAGCDRTEHGHGPGDGLYRHIHGLYEVVEKVRKRHPEVLIEACSSGGLRLDLGTLAHFDCIFLSDPDYPVHNLQVYWGALDYLPPERLLHWTWSQTTAGWASFDPNDPALTPERLDYAIRTGLLGMTGCSQKLPDFPDWVAKSHARHFAVYREKLAPLIPRADVYRLTGQPTREGGGDRWCAFEYMDPEASEGALFVFRCPGAEPSRTLHLKGLDAGMTYRMEWDGTDRTQETTGVALMQDGLTFEGISEEGSALVFIRTAD